MQLRNAILGIGLSSVGSIVLCAGSASGAIVGVSGGTTFLGSPPPVVLPGALTGATAFAWDEQQNRGAALNADMLNNPGTSNTAIAGPIAGIFDSHFIHFDGIPGVIGVSGSVTFNNPIIAVMFNQTNLDLSDGPLGSFGTVYPTGFGGRGTSPQSFFSINANVLTFNLVSTTGVGDVEQIRVLTQAPTPGAASLLAIGGLMTAARRRRDVR